MAVDLFEILICLVVIFISYLAWILWKNRMLPPGPWGFPIVGYLPRLDPIHPYLTMAELVKTYGSIYSMQMGKLLTVVISDPKIIRSAFNKDELSGRADLYLAHGIFNGHGLIGIQGSFWKEQRKFAVTCLKNLGVTKFGPKREKLARLILDGVDGLMQELNRSDSTGKPIETVHAFNQHLGYVINLLLFGRTWKEDDFVWQQLQHFSDDGLQKMGEAGVVNFLPWLRFFPYYKAKINFVLNGLDFTHLTYKSIIDEHTGEEDDIIAHFLKEMKARGDNPGSFTEKQLVYLLGDMFGASLDTSSSSLRWFLLCIACHPNVQKKLHEEIDCVCKTSTPNLDDAPRLPYLEAVINETLRFRTVVPMGVPHAATKDCTLEGYFIPEGTMIIPLQWVVHMHEDYWNDPHLFKPERFLNEEGKVYKPDAFIPFQIGKRICLGEELGKTVLFLFASNIVKDFDVSLPPDAVSNGSDPLQGEFQMLLKPKCTHLLFTRRKTSTV